MLLGPWEGRRCLLGREELGGVTWLGRGSLMTSPVSARPGNHRTLVGRAAGALQPGMDVHLAAARWGVGGEGGGGGLGRGRPRALCGLGPVSLPSHSGRETYRSVRSWGVLMEKPRPDPQGLWRPRGGPDTRPRSGWGPNTVCNFSACRAREDKGLGANGGTGGGLRLPLLRTPSCPPGPRP